MCLLLNHGLFQLAAEVVERGAASQKSSGMADAALPMPSLHSLCASLSVQLSHATASVSLVGIFIIVSDAERLMHDAAGIFLTARLSPLCLALQACCLHAIAGRRHEAEVSSWPN